MILRTLLLVFTLTFFAGCPKVERKPTTAKAPKTSDAQKPTNEGGDAAFQAFLARLRKAVAARDVAALSSMMELNFGYRWDDAPPGETPFAYWDANNLWGELAALTKEKWVPHNGFMVAPPQFAEGEDYRGYRAGLTMVKGNWRFAYFVSAPPANL